MFDCQPDATLCLHEIEIHATSYHPDRSQDFNERNFGLGLRISSPKYDDFYLAVGEYKNSIRRTTAYGGVGGYLYKGDIVGLRLTGGVATGYFVSPLLFVIPEVTLSVKGYGVAVGYLPPVSDGVNKSSSVFTFTLIKRF